MVCISPYLYDMFYFNIIATGFWERLLHNINYWDQTLFLKINRDWTNSFLDNNFPWWRDATTWIPLYLFLIIFVMINFRKKAWFWIFFVILTAAVTDQASSVLFKNWFNRVRPCNDPFMQYYVRLLLSRCPSSQSFTSSHATNHFGAAVFIYTTLKEHIKKWGLLLFFWAASISYGQVYVGVHYPLDIIGGAVLGSFIGYATANIYKRRFGWGELKTAA